MCGLQTSRISITRELARNYAQPHFKLNNYKALSDIFCLFCFKTESRNIAQIVLEFAVYVTQASLKTHKASQMLGKLVCTSSLPSYMMFHRRGSVPQPQVPPLR